MSSSEDEKMNDLFEGESAEETPEGRSQLEANEMNIEFHRRLAQLEEQMKGDKRLEDLKAEILDAFHHRIGLPLHLLLKLVEGEHHEAAGELCEDIRKAIMGFRGYLGEKQQQEEPEFAGVEDDDTVGEDDFDHEAGVSPE